MRKHPLIALTAFTALTASAIAGASTGSFQSTSALTSARTHQSSSSKARDPMAATYGAELAYRVPSGAEVSVIHDSLRPPGLRMSRLTRPVAAVRHKVRVHTTPTPALESVTEVTIPAPPPIVTTTTTTTAPPKSSTSPAGGVWYELRVCESGDNYAENTGNGYYGAYQFALATWEGLGYSGLPSDASPATQDQAAQKLQAEYGWGQWPGCASELGL